jgi:hypothetical protein
LESSIQFVSANQQIRILELRKVIFSSTVSKLTNNCDIEKLLTENVIVGRLQAVTRIKENVTGLQSTGNSYSTLGHLSMTVEIMVPYSKGFYLTLGTYLNQRDDEDGNGQNLLGKCRCIRNLAIDLLTK